MKMLMAMRCRQFRPLSGISGPSLGPEYSYNEGCGLGPAKLLLSQAKYIFIYWHRFSQNFKRKVSREF